MIYAWDGGRLVNQSPVSTGMYYTPTVKGEFRIYKKYDVQDMRGNYPPYEPYYIKNVPNVMYFYKGFGLHGTYWHNNFGQPMSHGCVNLATPDAEKLYYWTNPVVSDNQIATYPTTSDPGTRVVIHS